VVVYRNVFSVFALQLPAGVGSEGMRAYIDADCGYSGKAKKFKALPDADEAALIVSIQLLLPSGARIAEQCLECFEYFRRVGLFKTNAHLQKSVLFVKNNLQLRVVDGGIEVRVKTLCASAHQGVDAFVADIVVSDARRNALCRSQVPLRVKQV
jgi:hypothetical protein